MRETSSRSSIETDHVPDLPLHHRPDRVDERGPPRAHSSATRRPCESALSGLRNSCARNGDELILATIRFAQLLLAGAQRFLRLDSLDEIGRLPPQQIEETQLTLGEPAMFAQCVENMPSGRPERLTSGVDCAQRIPASRCSLSEPSGSGALGSSNTTNALSPFASATPQGECDVASTLSKCAVDLGREAAQREEREYLRLAGREAGWCPHRLR